jgi:tRNA (adenine37-N6)-methyltransferase
MINQQSTMTLKPIGCVRNGISSEPAGQDWESVISDIVINPEMSDALDNLDEYSHIIILFWTFRAGREKPPDKIRMRNNPGKPLVGLFATRSPDRPNPISKTTVKLLKRDANILRVQGLDAFDGTQVIDIKPYIPGYDSVEGAKVPGWVRTK